MLRRHLDRLNITSHCKSQQLENSNRMLLVSLLQHYAMTNLWAPISFPNTWKKMKMNFWITCLRKRKISWPLRNNQAFQNYSCQNQNQTRKKRLILLILYQRKKGLRALLEMIFKSRQSWLLDLHPGQIYQLITKLIREKLSQQLITTPRVVDLWEN